MICAVFFDFDRKLIKIMCVLYTRKVRWNLMVKKAIHSQMMCQLWASQHLPILVKFLCDLLLLILGSQNLFSLPSLFFYLSDSDGRAEHILPVCVSNDCSKSEIRVYSRFTNKVHRHLICVLMNTIRYNGKSTFSYSFCFSG